MSLFNRVSGRGGTTTGANPGNKPVCKFFLEGRCRFGDQCHNYHPPRESQTTQTGRQQHPYHLSADSIKSDLTNGDERPTWPLSAFGPGRDAPRQLLEGALEQSPEELRVQCYLAKAGGSTQQYEQSERAALDQANQQVQQVLSDLDGAIKYIIDGKDEHPNRDDLVIKPSASFTWKEMPSFNQSATLAAGGNTLGQPSAFGGGPTSTSAFGKPSAFGSGTAFGGSASTGGSAFGAGQSGGTSAFGKPSPIGGSSTPFGQPSAIGGGSTAFGKPSGLGGTSAFGAQSIPSSTPFGQSSAGAVASPFGQTSATTSGSTFGQASAPGGSTAFGQSSAPASGSAFGKPSPFGAAATSGAPAFGSPSAFGAQKSSTTSTFGQSSQPSQQPSAFGQPSQPAQQTSAFGQPSQPAQQPSAFGQPSQPGQQLSAFGQSSQPTQQSSPFGQPSQAGQQQQSTFGKPSPFGSSGGTTLTFGQSTFGASSSSAFGRPSSSGGQQQSAFGDGGQSTGFGGGGGSTGAFGSQEQAPNTSTFGGAASRTAGQPITSFKGQRVNYRDRVPCYRNPTTGKDERIWFPDGAPGPNVDVEASAETYQALGAALKEVYDFMQQNGTFKDGIVPEIPPKREWVSWDL